MVEYTVILAFGIMMLLGPGGDVLLDLRDVFKNNYRGYTYALSMSPLPDFGNGQEMREYIEDLALDPELDDETIDRLTVDPVQDAVTTALSPLTSAYSAFNDIDSLLGSFEDLGELAVQMLEDAISPF
jgi:hypothetical protein